VLLHGRLLIVAQKTLDVGHDVRGLYVRQLAQLRVIALGEKPAHSPIIGLRANR